MPGKKQLQQFSKDVLKIGDEVKVRASRGEKPAIFAIPEDIYEDDDSQDFVFGMPEKDDRNSADISENKNRTENKSADSAGDFDFGVPDNSRNGGAAVESVIPDLDSILNGGTAAKKPETDTDFSLPDSDFDLDNFDLDGFDFNEPGTSADPFGTGGDEPGTAADPFGTGSDESGTSADPFGTSGDESGTNADPFATSGDNLGTSADPFGTGGGEPGTAADPFGTSGNESGTAAYPFGTGGGEPGINADPFGTSGGEPGTSAEPIDLNMDLPPELVEVPGTLDLGEENRQKPSGVGTSADPFSTSGDDLGTAADPFGTGSDELGTNADPFGTSGDDLGTSADPFGTGGGEPGTAADPFGTSGDDLGTAADPFGTSGDESGASADPFATGGDELGASADPFATSGDGLGTSADLFSTSGNEPGASADPFGTGGDEPGTAADPFGTSGYDLGASADPFATSGDAGNSDEKIDTFNDIDVSDLENIDFSSGKTGDSGSADFSNIDIKDTDESFSHSDDDFDLGGDDEFYIPGFSDTLEADLDNAVQKTVNPVELGKAQTSPAEKNSITEDEYKKFKKNLSHYPLNVKIAIEEMIANDEFTKDTVFEVIEKVIKKVSARNLASHLEKILDISLPVPRDFEHRTVEEYEAYKASFEYQLKNRIIPVILLSLGLGFISLFLFLCGKHYIYRPLKANSLYKQGYALLEADEYPQAEQRFKEAVRYRNIKSWFYKFAQGYRNHKQYERAAVMYDDILKRYKNDKQAGLEYARMQWQDLSDYEGAIRILNDRLLLYFVNDADGLLELGDIYLDWGDNGNPEMYENARSNYASLMSLYGAKDLYLSRMLRYFIKTDDLKEVLRLKEIFYPKKKTLGAMELTELSGYMFEKMTGKLSPSEAYLKDRIEDVKALMEKAIEADPTNPTALYNMARYYINMTNFNGGMAYLDAALDAFKNARTLKKADVYKQIDSYRLKGEIFIKKQEIIKAVETFTDGISTFKAQVPALPGNHIIGQLYSDMADIDYFKFNNIDSAFEYYKAAIENENDTPSIRYKIGAIQYEKGAMQEAMGSFMATAEAVPDDNNLLMALGNVLINRNSYNAAKGYFEKLIDNLNVIRSDKKIMIPQSDPRDEAIVDMYMKACNNLGVILYNLAKRTGNSQLRAQATINFTESMRAGDALTRNQTSMKRKDVSNLAEENIRYMIKPGADFEPAAYPDIPRTLSGEEKGLQVF
ncbi:MAG: tetratricopeptide repeat protein [Treponema sp.]|nr:tetratricopeptide repeat protein [Treponema sp.]